MRATTTRFENIMVKMLVALLALVKVSGTLATTVTNNTSIAANQTFDYVVVGAGPGGITVANKLSKEGYSVLIIEAGTDPRRNPAIYNAFNRNNLNGYCNWQYTGYDEDGQPLSTLIDSGMCLGGSTSINGMMWYRPTANEMDMLEYLGNEGWNWASLEPYFEAIERNHIPTAEQIAQGATYDPAVHGYNGAVNTSYPTPLRIPEGVELYKETLPSVFPGLTIGNDLSNRTSVVAASAQWSIWYDNATGINYRSSAADALLWAVDQQQESLTVLIEHKVAKVLFDSTMTATGVQFGTNATGNWTVYASKEVILSAGSLATAPILERSGIGNATVLEAAGVEQLVNLPGVGTNLVDQPGTETSALIDDEHANDTSLVDGINLFAPDISLVNIDEIWGANASSFADNLTSSESLIERANALVSAGAAANVDGAKAMLGAAIELIVKLRMPVGEFIGESYLNPSTLTAAFWPLTPLSRGHVHINTSDPFADPIITPRFLSDAFDQSVAVALAKRSRTLWQTPPISDIISDAFYSPASISANASDADWLAWYRETSYGASHWLGSTAMMPRELGGVVDSNLKVYGTHSLRVVDCGIMPFEITSHTQSMVYALAQKAADLIISDA